MKKFCLLIAFVASVASVPMSARAQEPSAESQQTLSTQSETLPRNAVVYHHELALTYGRMSIIEFSTSYITLLGLLTGGRPVFSDYVGSFTLAYKYRFNKVASLGVTYGFESFKTNFYADKILFSKGHLALNTLAVECDFRYLTRKAITLYSTVGLGATFAFSKDQNINDGSIDRDFGFSRMGHISLIGAKIGSYRAGGLIELGVGYKGLVNVGGYVRF